MLYSGHMNTSSGGEMTQRYYSTADVEMALQEMLQRRNGHSVHLLAAANAALSLPDGERYELLSACSQLANSVPKMGASLAFEVIVATGRAMAREEKRDGR